MHNQINAGTLSEQELIDIEKAIEAIALLALTEIIIPENVLQTVLPSVTEIAIKIKDSMFEDVSAVAVLKHLSHKYGVELPEI